MSTKRYSAGTVSVTQGNTNVVGVGTSWLSSLAAERDQFSISSGKEYDISKVISDTELALSIPFNEASASGQAYAIERTFTEVTLKEVALHAMPMGEYAESAVPVGSEVALTTNTAANVTSLALDEGDYDISAVVDYDLTGATPTGYVTAISPTSATIPPQAGNTVVGPDGVLIQNATFGSLITGSWNVGVPSIRAKIPAGGATIYLVAYATFSAGTVKAYGTLRARRAGE